MWQPPVIFRAIATPADKVLGSTAPAAFVQDSVNNKFFFAVDQYRVWSFEFMGGENVGVIRSEGVDLGGVENRESVWGIGHVQGNGRVLGSDHSYCVRAVKTGHELGDVHVSLFLIVILAIQC